MATLTADKARTWEVHGDEFDSDLPIAANTRIFAGSLVGKNAGYFRPLVAGDALGGVALVGNNNTGGAAGALFVHVRAVGTVVLPVTGVTGPTDEGSTVYASDDDTFTLTSAGNSAVGKIIRHVSSTTVVVRVEAGSQRSI